MSDTRWCKNCNGYGNHSTAWCHGPIHQPEPVVTDAMVNAAMRAYHGPGDLNHSVHHYNWMRVALAAALGAQCNATPHVEPDVTVTDAVVKALWKEFAPNLPGYITYGDIQTVAYDALKAQAGDA